MKKHSAKKEDEKTNQLRNYLKTIPHCSISLSATYISLRKIPSKKQPTMGTTPLFFYLVYLLGLFPHLYYVDNY